MSDVACVSCRSLKTVTECELCQEPLCKACVQKFSQDQVALLPEIPEDLSHTKYCRFCYDEKIQPVKDAYDETLARANEVYIFFTTQRKDIPLIRRSREVFQVSDCDDRDETVLRMAFRAAQQGFNAVTEVDLKWKKVRNAAHSKTLWSGTGMPAVVDAAKVDRQHEAGKLFERG